MAFLGRRFETLFRHDPLEARRAVLESAFKSTPRGGVSVPADDAFRGFARPRPRATTLHAARTFPASPLDPPLFPSMAIDFELSGRGPSVAEEISLADIQEAAVECGFTKPGVPTTKPDAQRANVSAFFKVLGVTCVSGFKKRFYAEKLPCPYPDMTPLIMEKVRRARRSEGRRRRDESRRTPPRRLRFGTPRKSHF